MRAEAHKNGGNNADEKLLHAIASEFCAGDFVDKEPGGEEQSNGHQYKCQMCEYCRIDRTGIPHHIFNTNLKE